MRTALTILLTSLWLYGCSQKHTASIDPTSVIVAGKDIAFGGCVLHITKRDGNSLTGIQMVQTSEGKETTTAADTGTISEGPKHPVELIINHADGKTTKTTQTQSSVIITLYNAKVTAADKIINFKQLGFQFDPP